MQDSFKLARVLQYSVSECVDSKCRCWSLGCQGKQNRSIWEATTREPWLQSWLCICPLQCFLNSSSDFSFYTPGNIATQALSYISMDGNRTWPLGVTGFSSWCFSLTSVTGLERLPVPSTTTCFRRKAKEKEREILNYLWCSVVGSFLLVYQAGLTSLGISTPHLSTLPSDSQHQSETFCPAAGGFIFCPLAFAMGGKAE